MKHFDIGERSLVATLSYLKKQPYSEVEHIVRALEHDIRESLEMEAKQPELPSGEEEQSN